MVATYHNHSIFSDGKTTVKAMVDAAAAVGVAEVGLSDHLTLHPGGRVVPWSMKPDQLSRYVETVRAEMARPDITVRLGIELDWFDGHEAALRRAVETYPFDYVLGSVHFVGEFPVDGVPSRWGMLTQDDIDALHRGYWERLARMARSGLVDIVAHLDLPKKFGHLPREQPWDVIEPALDAIAEHGLVVELNTAGWSKPCADAYPSLELLRACRERGIETMLAADAHKPDDLLRDFDRGLARLREAGYHRQARFTGRTRRLIPLENCTPSGSTSPRNG